MYHDEIDCKRYGRKVEGTDRAKVLRISDLLALQAASRKNMCPTTVRSWTYVLLSCALFLRKSEAANLRLGDIEIPVDHVKGEPVLKDGIPKHLFIHIRHSKTDQDRTGMPVCLYSHCSDSVYNRNIWE